MKRKIDEVDVKDINLRSDSETEEMEDIEVIERAESPQYSTVFVPSAIEKQIVRSSLAMIGRANSSDWNSEIHQDGADTMMLREKVVVSKGEMFEVISEVCYREEDTYCRVLYRNTDLGEEKYSSLVYVWDNDVNNDMIYLIKYDVETYYIVFSRQVTRVLKVIPDRFEDSWCYFRHVREHLDSISLFV